ncbi:MAG: hypothetical protein V9E98_00230 [Candidatus Nanopelagicales bacterium]
MKDDVRPQPEKDLYHPRSISNISQDEAGILEQASAIKAELKCVERGLVTIEH